MIGFDDRHLDVRIVVDVGMQNGRSVRRGHNLGASHNLFGRLYITAVGPFHRKIVKNSMQALQPSRAAAVRTAAFG